MITLHYPLTLMVDVWNENHRIYNDFSKDKELFDFSDYSARSKYYDDSNKCVFRKMKDETGDVAIEFILSRW